MSNGNKILCGFKYESNVCCHMLLCYHIMLLLSSAVTALMHDRIRMSSEPMCTLTEIFVAVRTEVRGRATVMVLCWASWNRSLTCALTSLSWATYKWGRKYRGWGKGRRKLATNSCPHTHLTCTLESANTNGGLQKTY